MRFQVPQFIETETKIVGPFTLKQFLWVAGGVAIIFLLFMTLPLYAFIIFSLPVGAVFGSLAFIKIDNIPLFNYFVYSVAYMLNPRRYFFKKSQGDSLDRLRPTESPKEGPIKKPDQPAQNENQEPPKDTTEDDTKGGNNNQDDGYIKQEYIVK